MVDIYGTNIFKKNEPIKLNIDCCRIIDEFGFSYYMEELWRKNILRRKAKNYAI